MRITSLLAVLSLMFLAYGSSHASISESNVNQKQMEQLASFIKEQANNLMNRALFNAICKIESNKNPKAYSKKDGTVGIAQIKNVVVKDVNSEYNLKIKHSDMYDVEKSYDVFEKYTTMYIKKLNIEDTSENKAKIWNGGPGGRRHATGYWKKVKKVLPWELAKVILKTFQNA